MDYELEREQWVPAPLESVFPFFAEATNLAELTPRWLGFRIHNPPAVIAEGVAIEYTIQLLRLPLRWRSRIVRWDPPRGFVDIQERGPYAHWHHHHTFTPLGEGVLLGDRVRYRLPLGPLGRVAHAVGVRTALCAIFDYRAARVRERFGAMS